MKKTKEQGSNIEKKTKKSGSSITRREFIKKSSAVATWAVLSAVGTPYIVKAKTTKFVKPIIAGLNAKPGDPYYQFFAWIPEILKEKYDIDMEFRMYDSMSLGTDRSLMESVMRGFIDVHNNSTGNYAPHTNAWKFLDLPYIIRSRQHAHKLFRSDVMQEAAAKAEKDMPVKVLPFMDSGGFRILMNNRRELKTPADVTGLKFRVIATPIARAMIAAWGGNPTPLPWAECYTSIQSGVIDGFHVQPVWVYTYKFHEILPYGTHVKANYTVHGQVMNINTWNAMPKEIQTAFMAAAVESAERAQKLDNRLQAEYLKKMSEKTKFYTPTEKEFQQWYKNGKSIWKDLKYDRDMANKVEKLA
jgi:TRAP-type C4-dicarboxylate transport system substrate-binding protein